MELWLRVSQTSQHGSTSLTKKLPLEMRADYGVKTHLRHSSKSGTSLPAGLKPRDGINLARQRIQEERHKSRQCYALALSGEVRAGELGCLIHDAAAAAAQGGFGAVWGSKNLKAISVLGSGSIPVADPKALLGGLGVVRD